MGRVFTTGYCLNLYRCVPVMSVYRWPLLPIADFYKRATITIYDDVHSWSNVSGLLVLCTWSHLYFPASEQAVVSGVVPSPPLYVPSVLIAHRVIECCWLTLSRFPRVNLCTRKSPYEFIGECTRGDSNETPLPHEWIIII